MKTNYARELKAEKEKALQKRKEIMALIICISVLISVSGIILAVFKNI